VWCELEQRTVDDAISGDIVCMLVLTLKADILNII